MSYVKYNGNRLIPAPLVNIGKTYTKSNDGSIIGSIFNVSLVGEIVAWKGSPASNGTWHTGTDYPADESIDSNSRLSAIQRKQEAIRTLFADEGKSLIIQALDGTEAVSGYPRVVGIEFPEGIWYDRSPYTINLELDTLYPENEDDFTYNLASAEESWTIDTDERPESIGDLSRTYRLSHTVSATGKLKYTSTSVPVKEAWREARDWVHTRLGFDSYIALSSGVNNLPSYYGGYNHARNEVDDKRGGSYSVSETWILASGTALEDFSVSTNTSRDKAIISVTINGNIIGLEQRDSDLQVTTTKYANALSRFNAVSGLALTRAQTYSGETLNILPESMIVGRSPTNGTINYTFNYNNRTSNLIANAKSEKISVNDTAHGGESFAELFVLDRGEGPILQDLGTRPSYKRTLSIELVVNKPSVTASDASIKAAFYDSNPRADVSTSGDIQTIIDAINPINQPISMTKASPAQENWDFLTGRYSYNQTWTYVPSG